MNFDEILKTFLARPAWQRVFFAFTLGVFMSCSMRVAQETPETSLTMSAYAP
jgi:hypothetical protein